MSLGPPPPWGGAGGASQAWSAGNVSFNPLSFYLKLLGVVPGQGKYFIVL